MSPRRILPVLTGGIAVLAMLACSLPSLPSGSTPVAGSTLASGSTPAAAIMPASASTGACSNPWEPVAVGDSWNYSVTGHTSGAYVRSIQTVSADGFSDQTAFSNGITRTGQWKCSGGTLTAVDPFSSDVATSNSAMELHTTTIDGTSMAASVKVGDAWSMTYHMAGSITQNGKTSPVKEDVSESCTADGTESATVAAGTFDALHLTCKLGLTMTMTIGGSTYPTVSTSEAQRWYARNVGLVKSTDKSSAGVREVDLTSYKIP